MFSILAHTYYYIYQVPHSAQQLINLRAIFGLCRWHVCDSTM